MITKIINGGESGVELGALKAAKQFGVKTSGLAHQRYLNALYNLKETKIKYPQTFFGNTKNSDGILFLYNDVKSTGLLLAEKASMWANKPIFTIKFRPSIDLPYDLSVSQLQSIVSWIKDNNIQILNISGPRENKYPGIEECAGLLIYELLRETNKLPLDKIPDQETKFLWRILIPWRKLSVLTDWDNKALKITGGLTIYKNAIGYYNNIKENMIPVEIYCTTNEISQISDMTAKHFNQKAIFYYKLSNEVYIKEYK